MNRIRASLVVLPLCLAPALFAQKPIAVEATIKKIDPADRATKPPVSPMSESVTLSQKAPAGVTAPAGCTDAWLGTCEINKKKIAIAVGKSKADAENVDIAFIDLNGDGKFDAKESMPIEVTKREGRAAAGANAPAMYVGKPVDITLSLDAAKIDARFGFQRQGETDPRAVLSFPCYLEAKIKLGDDERIIAVQDKDYDGKYGSAGDLWVLAKAGANPANAYGMSGLGESRFENGKQVGIEVAGTAIRVTSTDAKGPDPKALAAQRHRAEKLWSDRFDQERAEFVKARGMDEARAKADKAIAWNYVTFAEGLEMAKKANKPLFVDVMAFWCVWCYRMDYYTYCDKEVADLMNGKFIPVKIIQEQDAGEDYKKLMDAMEAKGIPAMGIFDGEGKVLHKIGGWSKPEKFLEELNKGLK